MTIFRFSLLATSIVLLLAACGRDADVPSFADDQQSDASYSLDEPNSLQNFLAEHEAGNIVDPEELNWKLDKVRVQADQYSAGSKALETTLKEVEASSLRRKLVDIERSRKRIEQQQLLEATRP